MGREDQVAGKMKSLKGRANDAIGGATNNPDRQAKGKVQKVVGKAQEKLGKLTK